MYIDLPAKLIANAKGILQHTLRVKREKGEKVFVVHDIPRAAVGQAFVDAAKELDIAVRFHALQERRFEDGGIEALLADVSHDGPWVFVNVFNSGATRSGQAETPFRVQLLGYQTGDTELFPGVPENLIPIGKQSRVMHSPGITEEVLLWDVDYGIMEQRLDRLSEAFKGAVAARIETAIGTSLVLGIGNRPLQRELTIEKLGAFSNWPPGEGYVAPIEDSAEGPAVVDGTIGDFGVPPRPLKMIFEKGRIVDISYLDASASVDEFLDKIRRNVWQEQDPAAAVIGELGVGVADFPQRGTMLIDEKIYKTAHFAVGNNLDFGGVNRSKNHRDFLMWHPTITFIYADGSSRVVMKEGELV